MLALRGRNISKTSKSSRILKDANIDIEKGKIIGILGDNFSGRIELLKILSGAIKDFDGELSILGVEDRKKYSDEIGVSLDINGFIEEYTGFKNLRVLASIRGKILDEDIKDALYILGLDPYIEVKVKEYDKEMRKKLSIAQAIMERPKIIIIDQPFAHLGDEGIKKLKNVLVDICDSRRASIILGVRNLNDIEDICKDVYSIHNGELERM